MQHVVPVQSQAKQIGGNEAELRGTDADDADDGAVGTRYNPALPFAPPDQVGREQRKSARDVVEMNQIRRAQPAIRTRSARRRLLQVDTSLGDAHVVGR